MKSKYTGKKLYPNGYGCWAREPWPEEERGPLWRRVWQDIKGSVGQKFEGPIGPQGPMGCVGDPGPQGPPGYLQLSGFPDGTRIVLYDENYKVLWSGKLERPKKVLYSKPYPWRIVGPVEAAA